MSHDLLKEANEAMSILGNMQTVNNEMVPDKDQFNKDFEASLKKVTFEGLKFMKDEERTDMANKFVSTILKSTESLVDGIFANYKKIADNTVKL
jgi:hypothetical protein